MQAIPKFAESGTPLIPNRGKMAICVSAPITMPDNTFTVDSYADDLALCNCDPFCYGLGSSTQELVAAVNTSGMHSCMGIQSVKPVPIESDASNR